MVKDPNCIVCHSLQVNMPHGTVHFFAWTALTPPPRSRPNLPLKHPKSVCVEDVQEKVFGSLLPPWLYFLFLLKYIRHATLC